MDEIIDPPSHFITSGVVCVERLTRVAHEHIPPLRPHRSGLAKLNLLRRKSRLFNLHTQAPSGVPLRKIGQLRQAYGRHKENKIIPIIQDICASYAILVKVQLGEKAADHAVAKTGVLVSRAPHGSNVSMHHAIPTNRTPSVFQLASK
jgi:hypothetical protein